MTQSGSCWLIKFTPCETIDEELSFFFEDYFDVVAVNYTDDGLEEYVGYKGSDFNEDELRRSAEAMGIALPPYTKEFLESKNWLKENVIKFAPVEVEDFIIYGIHEQNIPPSDKVTLRIYAATAFGSEHQTTKSCLKAISYLNKLHAPHKNILDMGTGSGILALAAAKLWQGETHITAVDIDPEAAAVTLQNAKDNNLEHLLTVAVSDGYNSDLVQNNAPYDIVLANILARPLIGMAPQLYAALKPGGYCVLSGFVEEQEDWVIGEHTKLGLKLVELYKLDNWRAALLEKK